MSVSEQQRFQRRVISVVRHLNSLLDKKTLTVDQVDAAFYWAVVHQDRIDRAFGIDERAEPEDAIANMFRSPSTPRQVIQAIRDSQQGREPSDGPILSALEARTTGLNASWKDPNYQELNSDLQAELPGLLSWILFGKHPSMWEPWVQVNGNMIAPWVGPEAGLEAKTEILTIFIPDARLGGKDVEKFIERTWSWHRSGLGAEPFWAPIKELQQHEVAFSARLNRMGRDDREARGLPAIAVNVPAKPIKFPFVEFTITNPRSARGLISHYYESVVVKDLGWTQELQGRSNRQTPLNAIRGWGVGLLSNTYSGLTRDEAYLEIHKATGTKLQDKRYFSEQVTPVIERVPWVDNVIGIRSSWRPDRFDRSQEILECQG